MTRGSALSAANGSLSAVSQWRRINLSVSMVVRLIGAVSRR
jgi:hypothetical protein